MHLLDDAGDDDGFALIVIEGLADEMSFSLGNSASANARVTSAVPGKPCTSFGRIFDIGGAEVLAVGELHTQRLHAVFVGVVVGHRRLLALLVGQGIELGRTAATRQWNLGGGRGVDDARHFAQHRQVGADHREEVEVLLEARDRHREHVLVVDARMRLPILLTRCCVTNTAFTTMASVSAIWIATSIAPAPLRISAEKIGRSPMAIAPSGRRRAPRARYARPDTGRR